MHFTLHFSTSSLLFVTISDSEIVASSSARNLGVKIDHNLYMGDHSSSVCHSTSAVLCWIGQICLFSNSKICARLVHALKTSRLDSCSLLRETNRLQRVQNTVARLLPGYHIMNISLLSKKSIDSLYMKEQYTNCFSTLTRLFMACHLFKLPLQA